MTLSWKHQSPAMLTRFTCSLAWSTINTNVCQIYPLNCVLQVKRTWKWTKRFEQAFKTAKELITSEKVLSYQIYLFAWLGTLCHMASIWLAARLQRWALLLSAHDYMMEFKRTTGHRNGLSLGYLVSCRTNSPVRTWPRVQGVPPDPYGEPTYHQCTN